MLYYVVPNEKTYVDCNSPNVIKLIICNRRCLQYVEKTVKKLNKDLNCIKVDLTKLVEMDSVSFCQIISTKLLVALLFI